MSDVNEYYRRQAKDLTDTLFDKNFLNSELTRESIARLEDLIGFIIQSNCLSAVRMASFVANIKKIEGGS